MSTRFADTTHSSGPSDSLIVKDVYTEKGIGPSNNGSYGGAAGDAASASGKPGLGSAAQNDVEAAALSILAAILSAIFGGSGGSSKNPGVAAAMGSGSSGAQHFKPALADKPGGSSNPASGTNKPVKPALAPSTGKGPTGAAGGNTVSVNARPSKATDPAASGALGIIDNVLAQQNPSIPRVNGGGGNISNSDFGGHGNLGGQVGANNKDKGNVVTVDKKPNADGTGGKTTTNNGLSQAINGGNGGIAGGDTAAVVDMTRPKKDPAKELKDPISVIDQFDTKESVDVSGIVEALGNGNAGVIEGLTKLPSSVKDNLTGGFTQEQVNGGELLIEIKDKLIQVTPGSDPQVIAPIITIIESITKETVFIKDSEGKPTEQTELISKVPAKLDNKGGQAALIAGITYIGTKLGIPDLFNTLSTTTKDKRVLVAAATVLTRKAIDAGDKEIIAQLGKSVVSKEIVSIVPEVAQVIAGRIIPYDTLPQQEYTNYYQSVRQALDAVDPQWQQYKRSDKDEVTATAVYAYELHDNLFLHETMKAVLNQLMNPSNILAGYQSVYDEATPLDSSAAQYVKTRLEATRGNSGGKIDPSKLVIANPEYTPSGNAVGIRTMTIDYYEDGADASGAQVQVKKSMGFENEPFFILSQVYASETSVDTCIKRDFPEFYQTLDKAIEPCSPKAAALQT